MGLPVLIRWANGIEVGSGLESEALLGGRGFKDELFRGLLVCRH